MAGEGPLISAAVGFRHARFYGLDNYGLVEAPTWPAAAADAYDGYYIKGAAALSLTIPDAQQLAHLGEDRVLQTDSLPTQEAITGEATIAFTDLTMDALIQNVKVDTVGGVQMMPRATDQQGLEPDLAILCYRQATSQDPTTKGQRSWMGYILPKVNMYPKTPAGEQGGKNERTMNISPRVVAAPPWGIVFTLADNGCTEAQACDIHSFYRPHLAAWKGDGTEVAFDFTTGFTPQDTTNLISVFHWVLSTGIVTDVTGTVSGITTTEITFATAPAAGDKVFAFYQIANAQ